MQEIAISLKHISKKYRLFNSPQDRFWEALHPFNKKYHKEFWALKDVSFDVLKGQTVGIIGRNGSGKSTILQILCSILRPTSGEVTVNGRVSALLELGSGFNPEFTGRQNVLMKGQIMGFSETEMRNRLPEIEAFADIGEFIDQPMKIYSSGMSVRLAFATAINVDPDILVIDEALAVGDARFQHKCYGKFLDFQGAGKTIVFVTHDVNAIVKHCDSALLLEKGALLENGVPNIVVNQYIDVLEGRCGADKNLRVTSFSAGTSDSCASQASAVQSFINEVPLIDSCSRRKNYNKNEYRQGFERAELIDYLLVKQDDVDPAIIWCGDTVDLYLKARFHETVLNPVFGLSIKTTDGVVLFAVNSAYQKLRLPAAAAGDVLTFKYTMSMNLHAGDVFVDIGVAGIADGGEVKSFDRRCSIIHLQIAEREQFDGFCFLTPVGGIVAHHTTLRSNSV